MDISTATQNPASLHSQQDQAVSRQPFRVDAASWFALAAFVAYIGVGLLA